MTVEDLLREAITQHTAEVPNPPDRWEEIEERAAEASAARHHLGQGKGRKAAWTALGLVAAAVAALVLVQVVNNDSKQRVSTQPPATQPAPPVSQPGLDHSATSTPSGKPIFPPSTSRSKVTAFPTPATRSSISPYQPLWPFRTLTEASNWEVTGQTGGQQPWHLDAGQTALSFTDSYLGYSEIDKVVSQKLDSKGAHVAVGYANPNGVLSTAAVIHLVRFGSGATAPWEVVGTDDAPSFALTTPAYGARMASPATVGGTITGVDESVRLQILQLSSQSPLGTAPGVPAGGSISPWQTKVSWQGATDPVLTVAASTGGHLQGVERFTVTAVTTGK